MDQRWNNVLKSFLDFPEEVGAVLVSPTHAEIWKGTTNQCPYFKKYQDEKMVIVHSHPPSPERKYSPPSPTDLINCISSPNPHIVIAQEGFWVYSANVALKEEWEQLDSTKKEQLAQILTNNCYGVTASLVGGKFFANFAEGVSRESISVEEYTQKMQSAIPRKDSELASLGFHVLLHEAIPNRGVTFGSFHTLKGYEWSIDNISNLNERIAETSSAMCVTSDGSFVAF